VQGLFEDESDKDPRDDWTADKTAPDEPFILGDYKPQPVGETIRQSGLAWSAGIAFFVTIAFMLFVGWLADLLLGSSPWGVVGGIVLGSIIGFLQFFRTTSRIFQKDSGMPAEHPLMAPPSENEQPRRNPFDLR
jgi:F0F1-type ATP synthase assembly protein I